MAKESKRAGVLDEVLRKPSISVASTPSTSVRLLSLATDLYIVDESNLYITHVFQKKAPGCELPYRQ